MDEFENTLENVVKNGPQLIFEALQLENFIFSSENQSDPAKDYVLNNSHLKHSVLV